MDTSLGYPPERGERAARLAVEADGQMMVSGDCPGPGSTVTPSPAISMVRADSTRERMSRNSWTEDDIPPQKGRVAVVTGANSGLGFQTARALASKGVHVVLAVRSPQKGRDVVDRIRPTAPDSRLSVQNLDLASLSSVRQAAEQLEENLASIDLLIDNAGVMFPPKQQTEDGFELQFGVDYLGPFALAGLLFTYELQHRLETAGASAIAVAAHPGVSGTTLMHCPACARQPIPTSSAASTSDRKVQAG